MLRSKLFKAPGHMSAPTWLAAAQAAASARDPISGLIATPHTESASGSGPSVPAWLRAAHAAAGFAAQTSAGTPSVPTHHGQMIHRDTPVAARQARRVGGVRLPMVLQRAPPPRAAANGPPRTASSTIAEVRRDTQQRLLLQKTLFPNAELNLLSPGSGCPLQAGTGHGQPGRAPGRC